MTLLCWPLSRVELSDHTGQQVELVDDALGGHTQGRLIYYINRTVAMGDRLTWFRRTGLGGKQAPSMYVLLSSLITSGACAQMEMGTVHLLGLKCSQVGRIQE